MAVRIRGCTVLRVVEGTWSRKVGRVESRGSGAESGEEDVVGGRPRVEFERWGGARKA
jgi:hypothetical protein